jgi:pyruvate dehydrogenase E2 component (dihydrolipoamide acetyltransferase)
MTTELIMPKLGLTMTEGRILHWLKREGEPVTAGEPLMVVETDKVAVDVESPASGFLLKIIHPEGDIIPLETVIGYIGNPDEQIPTPFMQMKEAERETPGEKAVAIADKPGTNQVKTSEPIKVSPLAKKLAAEQHIDLNGIRGTGPQGRIVEADILRIVNARHEMPAVVSTPSHVTEPPSIKIPKSMVQRTTARRMAESIQAAPHFYLRREINVTRLVEMHHHLQAYLEARLNLHLTYTDLFIRALGLALPNHPLLNATNGGDDYILSYTSVNLGLAVAAPDGLRVGVLRGVERLQLEDILRERVSLQGKAKSNAMTLEDVTGATFTLTNLGMYGIDEFSPILNPPQSAILAIGSIAERPVGEDGKLLLRPSVHLTLAVDHRVADGVTASLFLQELCAYLISTESLF